VFDALQTAMEDIPQYLARVNDFITRSF
jgi:hypothetical protein